MSRGIRRTNRRSCGNSTSQPLAALSRSNPRFQTCSSRTTARRASSPSAAVKEPCVPMFVFHLGKIKLTRFILTYSIGRSRREVQNHWLTCPQAQESGLPAYADRPLFNRSLQLVSQLLGARIGELLRHLRHVSTFLGAVAASLGASGHLLVIGYFLAGSGTIVTTFRATFRRSGRESALPSAQRRAQLAAICAIHTAVHALGMILFPIGHERCAVMEARITRHLAISADGCALQHVGGMWTVGRERGCVHNE